jgi:hypothetical protein
VNGNIRYRRQLNDAGEWVEVPEYVLDGKPVSKDEFDAAFPDQIILPGQTLGTPSPAGWPMKSDAMAVHPTQIDLARKLDRDRGAPPTDYTVGGRPILLSERHKRAYIKAHGYHDKNSYS